MHVKNTIMKIIDQQHDSTVETISVESHRGRWDVVGDQRVLVKAAELRRAVDNATHGAA